MSCQSSPISTLPKEAVELSQLRNFLWTEAISDYPYTQAANDERVANLEFTKGRGLCEKADEVCSSMIWCVRD